MDEENFEEFNERFETIEDALKYTVDLQAKSEFIHKRDFYKLDKKIGEVVELQKQTQKHLDYITQIVPFLGEENEFQDEKLDEAGKVLSRKHKR